jgi:hypothetical protein
MVRVGSRLIRREYGVAPGRFRQAPSATPAAAAE